MLRTTSGSPRSLCSSVCHATATSEFDTWRRCRTVLFALTLLLAGCDTYLIAPNTVAKLADVPQARWSSVALAARRESDGKPVYVRNELIVIDKQPTPNVYRARVTQLGGGSGIAAIPLGVLSVTFISLGSWGVHDTTVEEERLRRSLPCEDLGCVVSTGAGRGINGTLKAASALSLALGLSLSIGSISLAAHGTVAAEVRANRRGLEYVGEASATPRRPPPVEKSEETEPNPGSSWGLLPRL